jgi:hypothetical protein
MKLFFDIESSIEQSMSDYQITNFVVNDHITPYRRLKQVVIELRSRIENRASCILDLEEITIKLEQLNEELGALEDGYAKRLKTVDLRRQQFQQNRKNMQLKLIDHEVEVFEAELAKLSAEFGGDEQLVRLVQDKAFRDAGEEQYWEKRLTRNLIADLFSTGRISKGVYETLAALPMEKFENILIGATIENIQIQKSLEDARDKFLIESN